MTSFILHLRPAVLEVEVFWRTLDKNGVEIHFTKMADGTIVTMRKTSTSDGTPVVEINISGSNHTGGIQKQKIHFVQGDFND